MIASLKRARLACCSAIYDSLKRKSVLLYNFLNQIEGVSCQPLQGAMYAFPR